jgi:protein-S-isoprenylcysteine O-methyltransferase Ste14
MMLGVALNLLGEATITASLPILRWLVIFVVVTGIAIPIIEEPGLARRFGDDYLNYKRNVPRWIPRWTPWEPN